MPKLCEVTGGTKTKIYCQRINAEIRLCIALDHQIGFMDGNQAKPLKYSEENKLYFVPI